LLSIKHETIQINASKYSIIYVKNKFLDVKFFSRLKISRKGSLGGRHGFQNLKTVEGIGAFFCRGKWINYYFF